MLAFGFVNLVHTAQAFKPYPRLLPASGIATLIAVFALLASSAKDSTVGDGGKDLMWPIVLILNWLAIYGMAAWSSAPETPEKTA
jgi:hypothetical protein